ncbi:HD domain-containing protein [Kitasatospora albolonga]|uniref:HD domain-containing protein n=1 Tax=Kitasatospora albolonga TaxID=68173 RepID=UPI0031ECAAB4
MLTLAEVDALAEQAHAGQVDKLGVPYIGHVRAVAAGLAPFGDGLRMAGLLHDVLEDTPLTAEDLLAAGVPSAVVATVRRVTRVAGVGYEEMVRQVAGDQAAALVKIADNAHNSHPDRVAALDPASRERLALRYRGARAVLWRAVPEADVRAVLELVNPALLAELAAVGG